VTVDATKKYLHKNYAFRAITLLVFLALLPYLQTLFFPLLWWDDRIHICQNAFLREISWENLKALWAQPFFGLYAPVTYSLWELLTFISKNIFENANDCLSWGPLFHFANLIFHILNVVFVFKLLKRVLRPASELPALIGAILFALHPLQVETVAWAAGARDLLCCFFGLLGLLQITKQKWLAANLFFLLSILSKANGVVFPILGLVLLWDQREPKRFLKVTPALIFGLAASLFAKTLQSDSLINFTSPLWIRPFIFAHSLGFYIWKTILPLDLAPDYTRSVTALIENPIEFWPIVILLLAIVLAMKLKPRKLMLSSAWILITLLPVSGLIAFGFQEISTVADHYFYLPMIGVSFLVAANIPRNMHPLLRNFIFVLLGFCGLISLYQTHFWQNDKKLFEHNVALYPKSFVSHGNLGNASFLEKKFSEAEIELRKALELNPKNRALRVDLGNTLSNLGRVNEAKDLYQDAINRDLATPEIFNNLAAILFEQGELATSEKFWKEAAKGNSYYFDPRFNLGILYKNQHRYEEALSEFYEAEKISPNNPLLKEQIDFIKSINR